MQHILNNFNYFPRNKEFFFDIETLIWSSAHPVKTFDNVNNNQILLLHLENPFLLKKMYFDI